MLPYAKVNNGYKYILVVTNCFSKFVWAYPLKDKSANEVCIAMEKVLKIKPPKNLQTDQGNQFFNKHFKNMNKYNVNHYSTFGEKKAAIVERVNRTLKNLMWKEFNYRGTYTWINFLQEIVHKYNNIKHRTIHMKPIDVTKKNEKQLSTVYSHIKISNLNHKFKIGDYVRISKIRGVFDKSYTANCSTEIFKIKKVKISNPTTYILEDDKNNEIQGGYNEYQLQKVKYPDVYLVEKVLKTRNNRVLVKLLGLDNTQ
ncbi:hypothetical protein QE152_g1142 [Popillia japonica]|uniref:Integrase catalytic domain-containing protein n=1 Tax=Popillia japonica TaxID=7064 RepID=A0AAW1NA63_POPJA